MSSAEMEPAGKEDQATDKDKATDVSSLSRDKTNSGGSGYYSTGSLDDTERKQSGRKDSETKATGSDYLDKDPCFLKIQGLPVSACRASLEASMTGVGVELDKIKTIQVNRFEKEAILEFHDIAGTQTTLQILSNSELMLEEERLRVASVIPDTDPLKLFVSGLSPKSTRQSLSDALELAGVTATDIQVGNTQGTALVTFASPSELGKFHTKYNKRVFDWRVINTYPVEVPKSVLIRRSGRKLLSHERLRDYLENFGNKGRSLDDIFWDYCADTCLATFRDFEDVIDACDAKEHDVDGCKLAARPYYPCLDLDSSVVTMPQPLELRGPLKHLVGFWNGSRIYKDRFQGLLRQNHGVLHRPDDDDRLMLVCGIDRMEPSAPKKLAGWAQRLRECLRAFSQGFSVEDNINVATECWDQVFQEDLPMVFSEDTGTVSIMELRKQDGHLVLAGETARVSELVAALRQREDRLPTWTKKKLLRRHELELLLMLEPRAWKGLKPTFLESEFLICFEGSKKQVEDAMTSLYHRLEKVSMRRVQGYGRMTKELLKAAKTSEYIKDKMRKRHLPATYEVTTNVVFVYALNERDIEPAVKLLVSCVQMKRHKLQANDVMNSMEWQTKLTDLYNRKEGLFQIELSADEMKLVCVDNCFEEIYNDMLIFFDSLTEMNIFFEIELGKWRFIATNRKDELLDIEERCKDLSVEMVESEVQGRKGFAIRGRKCDCQEILSRLRQATELTFHKHCKLSEPFFKEFVRSEECIQELLAVEQSTKCGLHIKKIQTVGHQPKEIASRRLGNQEIIVTEGDVTDMIVDIIVVPSDSCLQNISTVGAAIVEKAGFDFQVECDQYVRNKGELADGQIFYTKAGDQLPLCKCTLNVAVPVWKGGEQNEEQLLKLAIQNCLMFTTEKDCKTIVFPSLDCTLGYPVDVCTRVMVEAVGEYVAAIEGVWRIEKVYLCALTRQARHSLEAALRKSADRSFRTSLSNTDIKVHVVQGELAKQEVDVIVNSGNKDLNLRIGALSTSLLKEGGEQLQRDCRDMYPEGIRQAEVAVTSGGNMRCTHVFHGVLERWDGGKGRAEQIMGIFFEKCLSMVGDFALRSIAFPAIGTGGLGFKPEFVAELFLDCLYTYKCQNPATTLRDVYLVVYPGDKDTLQGFQEATATIRSSGGSPRGRYRSFSPQFFGQSARFMKAFGDLSVEILQGDITREKTEAIVNSVSGLNLDTGQLSRAIFSAAGPSIQTECYTRENAAAMKRNGFVITGSGYLDFCKKIIHLEAKDSKHEWKTAIEKCLQIADDMGIHSMSFPAIGTGGRGCTPALISGAMFSAIRSFSRSPGYKLSLRRVRVVIFSADMLGRFIAEASLDEPKRRSLFPRSAPTSARVDSDNVVVHLYGQMPEHLAEAEDQLKNLFTTETISIGRQMTSHLEKGEDKQAIERIALRHKVHVDFGRQEITIHGWRSYVAEAKQHIDEYIDKMVW